jgi:hypothetical protein
LVRVLVRECQRRDPQFVERCRQQLDWALGKMLLEPPIEGPVPREIREQIKVKQRETPLQDWRRLFRNFENFPERPASSKWRGHSERSYDATSLADHLNTSLRTKMPMSRSSTTTMRMNSIMTRPPYWRVAETVSAGRCGGRTVRMSVSSLPA